jgi:hypothetical protein
LSFVVPAGKSSTVTMTFFQPSVVTERQFNQGMKELDIEMKKLKDILER